MNDEPTITRSLANYLRDLDWRILQVHYPGTHGGMYFHPSHRKGRGSTGAIVADIVASHIEEDVRLLVESKNRYFPRDVDKLIKLTTDPAYGVALKRNLGIRSYRGTMILRAIALPEIPRSSWPPDFLVFLWKAGRFRVVNTYGAKEFADLVEP